MKLFFAPLEGMTDAVYRRVHHALFPGVHAYYMPFVSPSQSLSFTSRQLSDISPRENAGVPAVPQVLAKNSDYFLDMVKLLRDAGYAEVNLNLGCPSGTVTAKGKGAGMLRDLAALDAFLDRVYAHSVLPVSLKTRAGFSSPDEWPALLKVILRYPVKAWFLHPRTCREFYSGAPHRDFYRQAAQAAPFPVIYNGDLFTAADCLSFLSEFPEAEGLMLGRGLAANPALAREVLGGNPVTKEDLRLFHDGLYREYLKTWPEHAVVGRMHFVMQYLVQCLRCPAPALRALRKATGTQAYTDAAAWIFAESEMLGDPHFIPPEEREEPF